jgi:hypothetical protein
MEPHIIRDLTTMEIVHSFQGEVPRKGDRVCLYENRELIAYECVRVEWEMKFNSRAIIIVKREV